jgi:hypothetical protein
VRRGIRHDEVIHLLPSERLFPRAGCVSQDAFLLKNLSKKMKGMIMKKSILIISEIALICLLAGCSSTPVALAPVGPSPIYSLPTAGKGQLEVFSALSGRVEGDNPTWYQHSDYYVCNTRGRRLEHVDNAIGEYSEAPRIVTLPPGKYIVKARAKGILLAEVPVIIEPGQITKVHLDGNWQPQATARKTELVKAPAGYPVGWRAGSAHRINMN